MPPGNHVVPCGILLFLTSEMGCLKVGMLMGIWYHCHGMAFFCHGMAKKCHAVAEAPKPIGIKVLQHQFSVYRQFQEKERPLLYISY